MKKLKSSLTNMLLVLTVISVVAGGTLAAVNKATQEHIEKIKAETLARSIKKVLNVKEEEALTVEDYEDGGFVIHRTDRGVAIESTKNGFGGALKVLVGFDTEGTILGYSILETSETPGLGAKAGEWFQEGQKGCIVGRNPKDTRMGVTKGGEGDIDAITASTITSRAFLGAVQAAYDKVFAESGTDGTTSATSQKGGRQ
ncbi:MAG: RnfABCDGE type electron transport complex subunit G [Bacteroidaceae bacterium]|nr:RnfABCDGE type electron transport complex subunit G [Bacteroidaceae bacterium]